MPSLADYQTEVGGYLLARCLQPDRGGRDAIHRNNYRHALLEALRHLYPVVERLVGQAFFAAMAGAFIDNRPARSPVLGDYGDGFPFFVAALPPAASLPYLPDVARLELARHQVYHEESADPLPIDQLTAIPHDQLPDLRPGIHPAHRLLTSLYPVDDIWRANQADLPDDAALVLEPGTYDFLVVRPRVAVDAVRLGPGDRAFVEALKRGRTIAEAAPTALNQASAFELAACLRRLARAELFIAGADRDLL